MGQKLIVLPPLSIIIFVVSDIDLIGSVLALPIPVIFLSTSCELTPIPLVYMPSHSCDLTSPLVYFFLKEILNYIALFVLNLTATPKENISPEDSKC